MLVSNEQKFAVKIEEILKKQKLYRKLALKAGMKLKKELSWKNYYESVFELA